MIISLLVIVAALTVLMVIHAIKYTCQAFHCCTSFCQRMVEDCTDMCMGIVCCGLVGVLWYTGLWIASLF